MIELTTRDHTRYLLTDSGDVVARSDGPRGWNYSGKWTILGAVTRWNAHRCVSLAEIVDGADFGHGFIRDLDHGSVRQWGGHSRRLLSARKIDAKRESELRQAFGVPR
jgi:hypothetical protein